MLLLRLLADDNDAAAAAGVAPRQDTRQTSNITTAGRDSSAVTEMYRQGVARLCTQLLLDNCDSEENLAFTCDFACGNLRSAFHSMCISFVY